MDIKPTDLRLAWGNVAEWVARDGGLCPQRVPEAWRLKFEEGAAGRATQSAGMSLRFRTDSRRVAFRWSLEGSGSDVGEVYCDGRLIGEFGSDNPPKKRRDEFKKTGDGMAEWTILLPWCAVVIIQAMELDDGAKLLPARPVRRPLMLCYGDSITQGYCATKASRTWPYLLGQALDWDIINMGYGGAAFCEAEVAQCLAERRDWDAVTLAVGINTAGGSRESAASFRNTYAVFIDTLRSAHPRAPILCVTPMFLQGADDVPSYRNGAGCTVNEYREVIRQVVRERQDAGDRGLRLVEGLTVIDGAAPYLADTVHPNDAGMARVASVLAGEWRAWGPPPMKR